MSSLRSQTNGGISAYPFSTGLIILRQRYEIFNGFVNKYHFLFNGLNKSLFQTGFNKLLNTHPKLAIRLNSAVEGCIYGWCYPLHVPFAIIFEEVQADAEAIGGDREKQNL